MRSVVCLAVVLAPLCAAEIHPGVIAGIPFNKPLEFAGAVAVEEKRSYWTLGPKLEIDLAGGLGAEFGAIYRRGGVTYPSGRGQFAGVPSEKSYGLWDFPVLAKYRFAGRAARPFVVGGYSYRRMNGELRIGSSPHGFTIGGGVRIRLPAGWLSPELRFTRWGTKEFEPALRTAANQADLLVSWTF